MESINISQSIVVIICTLGIGLMLVRLFSADRCTFGGFHDWRTKREYQMCEIKECSKCKETKTIEK